MFLRNQAEQGIFCYYCNSNVQFEDHSSSLRGRPTVPVIFCRGTNKQLISEQEHFTYITILQYFCIELKIYIYDIYQELYCEQYVDNLFTQL